MIIYLSPAKTFQKSNTSSIENECFYDKRNVLRTKLTQLSKDEFKLLTKVSHKMIDDVYTSFHEKVMFGPAIEAFAGPAFKAFDYSTLQNKARCHETLFIGDAYYGLIRPQTNIESYRLDFTMSAKKYLGLSLVDYYKKDINDVLSQHSDTILDLSSHEYGQLLDKEQFKIIKPTFLKNGRALSYDMKVMRGLMARFVLENPQARLQDFQSELIKINKDYEVIL